MAEIIQQGNVWIPVCCFHSTLIRPSILKIERGLKMPITKLGGFISIPQIKCQLRKSQINQNKATRLQFLKQK